MEAHKKKEFFDYPVREPRTKALRIYVNKGELQIIDAAISETERDQRRSAWCADVLLEASCEVLGIPYPYKK